MPVSDEKIQFTYTGGATTFEVCKPVYGYRTTIEMPFRVQSLSNGSYDITEDTPLARYDQRFCECQFILTAAEMNTFLKLRDDAEARAKNLTITMLANSGFFPFGPDKGDVGSFVIDLKFKNVTGAQRSPYKHYRADAIMTNIGAWPAYSLPSDVGGTEKDTGFKIGTVQFCPIPRDFYAPNNEYAYHLSLPEFSQNAEHFNRGESADRYNTDFELRARTTKLAHIVNQLTSTSRTSAFNIIFPADTSPFGREKGLTGTYSVKLITPKLEIVHDSFNIMNMPMGVHYISGPT